MRAVVFDFFGTLTDPANEPRRQALYGATGLSLGVTAEAFWQQMSGSFSQRITGDLGGTRESLRQIAGRCGVSPEEAELDAAVSRHLAAARLLQAPRAGALATLSELRARGYQLGLLSDCSSELPELWSSSPYADLFHATVFSWDVGYRKPDPRGFQEIASRLGVQPSLCWFVGDGGSRELSGAAAAGMRPTLVSNRNHPGSAALRDDADDLIPDDVVSDIGEVLDLVGLPDRDS